MAKAHELDYIIVRNIQKNNRLANWSSVFFESI